MISRFFWVRRIRSSATRPTWADWHLALLGEQARDPLGLGSGQVAEARQRL